MSRVLITGVTGQDGAIAARRLSREGHTVVGTFRRHSTESMWRLFEMGLADSIDLREWRLEDPLSIRDILEDAKPDLVLHLAAESFPQDSTRQPGVVLAANIIGATYLLEGVRHACGDARVVMASSSEIFGRGESDRVVDEESRHEPRNPYGVSKSAVLQLTQVYRAQFGLRASTAILFNHESPFRGAPFVTRKISIGMARAALARDADPLTLGSLEQRRDWGSAEDFVGALIAMAQSDLSDDFIVASGHLTSVEDILEMAARAAGFEPVVEREGKADVCRDAATGRVLATSDRAMFRSEPPGSLRGNSSKLREAIGWVPTTGMQETIMDMVTRDTARLSSGSLLDSRPEAVA